MRSLVFVAVACCTMLGGCVNVREGAYVGTTVTGWTQRVVNGGICVYQLATESKTDRRVSFAAFDGGKLYVSLYFYPEHAVFAPESVKLVFLDTGEEQVLAPSEEMTFTPGKRSFSIFIPTFKVGERVYPEIKASFKWSGKKYNYFQTAL